MLRSRAWIAYLLIIVWVNAYICRQVFHIEYTGQMHAMHGTWIAMARLAGEAWWRPAWWPYWYGGMPFEFTYAPLVPALAAAYAKVTGLPAALGFNVVSGCVFCLGPLALFLMAWSLTRRPGWSFVAAMVYSLTAPTELVLPDAGFNFVHLGNARRLSVDLVWDEVPHQLALALVAVAILCLHRAFRGRRWSWHLAAGASMAGAVLANAFGATALLLALACFLPVYPHGDWKRNTRTALGIGVAAYLVVCPFLPPSLIAAMRASANLFPESAWTPASLLALAAAGGGWLLLWWLTRRWARWYLRFFLLLAWITWIIPALYAWNELHFIPQPGRYKIELEFALPLVAVFALARLVDRWPTAVRAALAIPLLWLAAHQVILHRRWIKNVIKPVDIRQTIEYQPAKWLEVHLPGGRVMAAGSIGQWMNAFTEVQQFTGGSYPTAPNTVQQIAMWGAYSGGPGPERNDAVSLLWLRAFGVDALVVPGRDSPEFWKPFRNPPAFDRLLPLLWRERGTGIYCLPRRNMSLAHVIPEQAVMRRRPAGWTDTAELQGFVAALEDPRQPSAEFRWQERNRAWIRAEVPRGEAVAVQINYHRGWKASVGGKPIPVSRDGLGQVVLRPDCAGACEIDLRYDGGWEWWLCRAVSALAMVAIAVVCWRR